MAYYEIHKALTQSIIDLALGVPIAHENSDYDPVNDDCFIDLTTITNDQVSLSKDTVDEVTGVYQISVYCKSGTSVKQSLDIVDVVTDYYKHNLTITNGSQNVVVINTGRNAGRNSNGWYIIDISVTFKSDILR